MEIITIVLLDSDELPIVRERLEIRDNEPRKNKLINGHISYLLEIYGEDCEISRIEIIR